MAKKTSRRKRLEKKAAKRKQRQRQLARRRAAQVSPSLSKAKQWPLLKVFITDNWANPMVLTQIMVVRKGPNNFFGIGVVLVDQACLGVKNAYGRVVDEGEYRMVYRQLSQHQTLIEADINLAAKIIRDSVEYAAQFGLRPNRDLPQALALMHDADPDACREDIPLGGAEGKPLFMPGPYDNVEAILAKLTTAVGPDGFDYILPLDSPDLFFGEIGG